MGLKGIAKVAIAIYKVEFEESDRDGPCGVKSLRELAETAPEVIYLYFMSGPCGEITLTTVWMAVKCFKGLGPRIGPGIYQDENKNNLFNHEKAWAVLRKHAKWDAPDPAAVDLIEDENVPDEHVSAVNTDELFGPGKQRPGKKTKSDTSASTGGCNSSSQFGEFMSHELRLKREAAEKAFEVSKEKDRTITRLKELRFLAFSTKDLSPDDEYWIDLQKKQIKDKLRSQMPRDSNNNNDANQIDDSDE
ncbi:hypothetical protein Tco_1310253 [Tanacetum coccineum]